MKLEFSRNIFKNTQISVFMKIHLVEAELFRSDGRTDGRTDMTKLIVAFRNFTNAPKSDCLLWESYGTRGYNGGQNAVFGLKHGG